MPVRASGLSVAMLVSLFVVLMPSFNLLPGTAPYNTHRLFQVMLLLGASLWLAGSSRARADWLQSFYSLPVLARAALLGMVGIGCLSAALAPFPRFAFLEVAHFVLLFFLTVALASCYRRSPKMVEQIFLWTISLIVLLYCGRFFTDYLFSLLGLQYAFYGKPGAIWPNGELRSFAHVRHFNQLQTWTLPLIVLPALVFADRGRLIRWTYGGLAMVWWMLLWASGGRGTTLAMGVAALAVVLLFRRRALPWLRAQGVALAGGALLYGLFFKLIANTNASLLERNLTDDSLRFLLWERAWEIIQQHPLLGAGPMHYAQGTSEWAAHPHNAILQWAAEWGVPAALLGVILVAWGLFSCMHRYRREAAAQVTSRTHVHLAIIAALVAATAHALLSGIIVMPVSQMMLVLVVGWCWGMCCASLPERSGKASRRASLIAALFVAASMGAVVWGTAPDAFVLKEKQAAYSEATHRFLRPRFWLQGYIAYEAREQATAIPAAPSDAPP